MPPSDLYAFIHIVERSSIQLWLAAYSHIRNRSIFDICSYSWRACGIDGSGDLARSAAWSHRGDRRETANSRGFDACVCPHKAIECIYTLRHTRLRNVLALATRAGRWTSDEGVAREADARDEQRHICCGGLVEKDAISVCNARCDA